MHDSTGIPIEYLFAIIGFLLLGIYGDVKRELRSLKRDGAHRDRNQERFRIALIYVVRHLKVPFAASLLDVKDEDDTSDTGENKSL